MRLQFFILTVSGLLSGCDSSDGGASPELPQFFRLEGSASLRAGEQMLFATDAAELKAGSRMAMNRLADFLRDHPERNLLIEGHTDSRGSDAYNEELSDERADAVAEALVQRGIASTRVQPVGMGEAYPVASNDTEAGRQQNRRVEIVVSARDGSFPEEARRASARR